MMQIKDNLRKIVLLRYIYHIYIYICDKDIFSTKASVIHKGVGRIKKQIRGSKNKIIIGRNTRTNSPSFHIIGHNNTIRIGDNCYIGKKCSFWMEGNNIEITIGEKCSFNLHIHFNAQEDNVKIIVGNDCMFSNNIIVRTSDSHPIYDVYTHERLNMPKDIYIGNHVWIAPDTKIMKGANISDNTIIGSNSMVSRYIPENCLAVGMPAKVVKEGVTWGREDIIFNNYK